MGRVGIGVGNEVLSLGDIVETMLFSAEYAPCGTIVCCITAARTYLCLLTNESLVFIDYYSRKN